MLERIKAAATNPAVITATLSNVVAILSVVGFNIADLDRVERVGALLITICIQWGVLSDVTK